VAVSETKSIARIARRTVLSNNALSVLVSILEETPGWHAERHFTFCEMVHLRKLEKVA
jgi:hypothetical protein